MSGVRYKMFIIYLTIFFIGLGFGSFSSVIIHRLHSNEKGIFLGRSKCPHCSTTLKASDLIPVLSYLIHRAKCQYCKKPISKKYPTLELTMGSFFLLTTYLTGLNNYWLLAFYLLVTFTFVLLSFYDAFFQEVPDEISLPTLIIVGLVGYFGSLHNLESLLIGFFVPVGFFGLLFFGSQGRWLGGGDIRIGAIMGLLLGWPNILVGLFLGYLLGSIYGVVGIATGKLKRKSMVAFGPFLFAGTYIALFWGDNILKWYLNI